MASDLCAARMSSLRCVAGGEGGREHALGGEGRRRSAMSRPARMVFVATPIAPDHAVMQNSSSRSMQHPCGLCPVVRTARDKTF